MKTVILAGGKGQRLQNQVHKLPKPMVEIGDKPMLWHIFGIYLRAGISEFIICLGYQCHQIVEMISSHPDVQQKFEKLSKTHWRGSLKLESGTCKVDLVDTGENTPTGGRILKAKPVIGDSAFMATYADGLSSIRINELMDFHRSNGKITTMTTVRPNLQFGVVEIGENNMVRSFKEKPKLDLWINGGFFVFNQGIFDFLNEDSVLEIGPLEALVEKEEVAAFRHEGFWKSLDTHKDAIEFNWMITNGLVPWIRKDPSIKNR